MDKVQAGIFQEDVRNALSGVLEKHGLKLDGTRLTYGSTQSSINIKVSSEGVDIKADDFTKYASLYGLSPEDLGKEITLHDGNQYTIVGLKPKARKNTILIQRKGTDSRYVIPHQEVSRMLNA